MTKTAFVPGGSAPSQSQPAKPGSQSANQTPPAKTEPEKGGAPAVEDRRIAQIEAVILKVYGRFCGQEWPGLDDEREEMAESEGFEPPVPFRVQRFSRPPVSTAHPALRG